MDSLVALKKRAVEFGARANRFRLLHPRITAFGIALAAYAAYEGVLHAFGMPMVFYWGKMQLLDRTFLLAHPLECLIYLHSQPPVLNGIAMIVLHGSELTGLSEAAIANGLYALFAWGCFFTLIHVARLATGSWIASAACSALLLLNPAFAFYRFRLLYETPAMLAVLLTSWTWLLFVKRGKLVHWIGLMLSLALLCLTKSLFHPIFALLVALLALAARRAVGEVAWFDLFRLYAGGFALGVVLVLLWPAKNQLVFDRFIYSSWLGFNLTVRTPVEHYEPFDDFVFKGKIHPSLQPRIDAFEGVFADDDLSVVLSMNKPSFKKIPNWNHLAVLYSTAELERRGIEWRLQHPMEWMRITAGRYFMTMRPSFVFPYSANTVFSGGLRYDTYAARYRDIVHPDLRPWFERVAPGWFVHRYTVLLDHRIPYTPFAFVYPAFLLACLIFAVRKRREPLGWFVVYCGLASAWTIVVPALTDGVEGNRMRLATAPLICVAGFALLQRAARGLQRRRAPEAL